MSGNQERDPMTAPYDASNEIHTTPAASADASPVPESELDRKIEQWKSELLDTGRRNRMIQYRESRRSTLRILEPEAAELFNRLAFLEKALTFEKPISKDTDFRTYSMIALMETLSYSLKVQVGDIKTAGTVIEREKTLKNLRSKAKLAQEEQGTNILYLCFGFLYWRAQNRDSSPLMKSPLLLMPVSLGIKSLNSPYTLSRSDDEIELNPTLEYLFHTEYHIELPKFHLKNRDSFDEYLAQIEQIVDKRGWKLSREVSLGLLSFSKISMYYDLENHRERMMKHPVLRALAGDGMALAEIPSAVEHFDFDAVKPGEWHEVVDADSSQEEAILLSKLGVSFVMQGPPGTGKSQTITNMIAEALADGKKVLFVSEKAAALEVVLKRLMEARLDDFCLSLHNYRANKKQIIDSIGANLKLEQEFVDRSAYDELSTLFKDREILTRYAEELHRVIEPLGESVYTVFGRLSKLEKATAVSFRLEKPEVITRESYSALLYDVEALEKALRNLGGPLDSNPWHATTASSSGQLFKQQMERETAGLSEKLRAISEKTEAFQAAYQAELGSSWDSVKTGIDELSSALTLPLFPAFWMEPEKLDRLLREIRLGSEERRALDAPLLECRKAFRDAVLDAPIDDWMTRARSITDAYAALGSGREYAGETYLSSALSNAGEVSELCAKLQDLSERYQKTAGRFGFDPADSFRNAAKAARLLELLAGNPRCRAKAWFQPDANAEALRFLEKAEAQAAAFHEASDRIGGLWSERVRDLDLPIIEKELFEESNGIYDGLSEQQSIWGQLSAARHSAQELQQRMNTITEAHARAVKALGLVREDSLEGLRSLSMLLTLAADVPFLETDWFDVRKNEAAQPLLAEALAHSEKISELTASLLETVEPEALEMEDELLAMLARFKTEHVGLFHRLWSSYREDIKKLRLLSKEVGRSIDEAEAIAFLQTAKALFDERRWFRSRQDTLSALAGSYYRGPDTDWNAVKRGMAAAAGIAESFPYANIPRGVVIAVQRAGSSVQSAAEIKELAEILSAEELSACEALLREAAYVDASDMEKSFGSAVLPGIRQFLERCARQERSILALQEHYCADGELCCGEIRQLLSDDARIRQAENWFAEKEEACRRLLGDAYAGAESSFGEIDRELRFAGEVIECFAGAVPSALVDEICADDGPTIGQDAEAFFSAESVEELRTATLRLATYCYSPLASLTDDILPRIREWSNVTERLAALKAEMAPFLSGSEVSAEQAMTALPAALRARTLRDRLLEDQSDLAHRLGDRYRGIGTDWTAIEADIHSVQRFMMAEHPAVTKAFLVRICDREEVRAEVRALLDELRTLCDGVGDAYRAFCGYFDETENLGALALEALAERYDRCLDGFLELNRWLDYTEAKAACDEKGMQSFTSAIAQKNNTVPDVRSAFERGFCAQWLFAVLQQVPRVREFRRWAHEQRVEEFAKLDQQQFDVARRRIRERIIRSIPDPGGMLKAGSELRILTHEMEKKRMIMPLRRLFQKIPKLLLTLKPCLMMSPLSVAYFLDADLYHFDMVIFDEASQIFPQDAIGAIFRADQVIIAGDTRQLPPTNFFAASTSNGSEGYDDDEGYDGEVYDSILEETASVLPNRTLLWHYRSKHEHLIAFSNQEIYKNELITFPSCNESEPDTGVEFVYVEDGLYEASPKNHNIPEARRIAALVKEHFDRHPERSLGVIAFSEKQQQAIALEIQRFREKNPAYEAFFAEGKEDEFFVKNLENVQGDERDTILFSVGYARTRDQRAKGRPMSMNFGPLGKAGGERRLNVAITRARINVKLVSSILPSDMDLSRTESEGVRMLHSYLEFAMHGEATLAGSRRVGRPDAFADSIAQFLRDHGYRVRQYVGCSGYKIDLAVQHPSESLERYVAGIECDGYSYAAARTTRDRDRLRSAVLKRMGWNLYRVWSAEWYQNPEVEGRKLLGFIEDAIAACDAEETAPGEDRRMDDTTCADPVALPAGNGEERPGQRESAAQKPKGQTPPEPPAHKRREKESPAAQAPDVGERAEGGSAEEQKRGKQSPAGKPDLSWVRPGAKVIDSRYGRGTVLAVVRDMIKIRYRRSERYFPYPGVIEKGLVTNAAPQEASETFPAPDSAADDER